MNNPIIGFIWMVDGNNLLFRPKHKFNKLRCSRKRFFFFKLRCSKLNVLGGCLGSKSNTRLMKMCFGNYFPTIAYERSHRHTWSIINLKCNWNHKKWQLSKNCQPFRLFWKFPSFQFVLQMHRFNHLIGSSNDITKPLTVSTFHVNNSQSFNLYFQPINWLAWWLPAHRTANKTSLITFLTTFFSSPVTMIEYWVNTQSQWTQLVDSLDYIKKINNASSRTFVIFFLL